MRTIETRLGKLEQARRLARKGALPHVVPDETPPEELQRLRDLGLEVFRFGDFIEHCFDAAEVAP